MLHWHCAPPAGAGRFACHAVQRSASRVSELRALPQIRVRETVWRVKSQPKLEPSPIATYESLQIIVTVPVLLDRLLCHSRAWLPREESRSFPTSSSGIRDSSRAPDTRAGMTEKFDRADVPCLYLVQDSIVSCRIIALSVTSSFRMHAVSACFAVLPLPRSR